VLGIWGLIVWRVVHTAGGHESLPGTFSTHSRAGTEVSRSDSDDHLVLYYRDPFLGERYVRPATVRTVKSGEALKPKPEVVLPEIAFLGMISNTKNKRKIAIIRYEGSERMVAEGKETGEIRVLKCWPDSVKITFNKKDYVLRK
jgi:hypothetical protein